MLPARSGPSASVDRLVELRPNKADVSSTRKAFNALVSSMRWLPENSKSGFISKTAGDPDGARLHENIRGVMKIGKTIALQKRQALKNINGELKDTLVALKSVREQLSREPDSPQLLRAEKALRHEALKLKVKQMETRADLKILMLNLRTLNLMEKSVGLGQAGPGGR